MSASEVFLKFALYKFSDYYYYYMNILTYSDVLRVLLCRCVRNLQGRVTETDVWQSRWWWSVTDESRSTWHWCIISSRTECWPTEEVMLLIVVTLAMHSASWRTSLCCCQWQPVWSHCSWVVRAAVAKAGVHIAALCCLYIMSLS